MLSNRNWDILLIGGASGSGKTKLSRPLAHHYGVDFVRIDDFQIMLETLTTPETHPALHYWNTHPDWMNEGPDAVVGQLIDVGELITPGLRAIINDHIEERLPMVMEGDFLLPSLAASIHHPKVKSIFIHEPERDQILENYLMRENTHQPFRADVSYAYGNWLAKRCADLGLMTINSRPWDTLLDRVTKALLDE